jgi:hypothetical protein
MTWWGQIGLQVSTPHVEFLRVPSPAPGIFPNARTRILCALCTEDFSPSKLDSPFDTFDTCVLHPYAHRFIMQYCLYVNT